MNTSTAGRKAIAEREGNKLAAYKCSAGVWTIGVGHTSAAGLPAVKAGMTITVQESDEILTRDLATFEKAVLAAVKAPLTQNQFDALVSLAFNIGAGAFAKSTLAKRLNARDYKAAAEQFLVWNKAGGRVLKGLETRRYSERAQFLKADTRLIERITAPDPAPIAKPEPEPYRNDGKHELPPSASFWRRVLNSFGL